MPDTKTLYQTDFLAWSKEQAEALRSVGPGGGSNQLLDWENLAEEIDSLGVSQKAALRSQLRRIIRHLLKLEFSPAAAPQGGWFESINDARSEIEDLLEISPTLKRELGEAIAVAHRQGSKAAISDLTAHGELDPAALARVCVRTYTAEQILGDWFPPEPPRGE